LNTGFSGKLRNGYTVSDLNKTMINVTKEPSDTHIKTLKEEILENISVKFRYQTWLTRMYKIHSRNFKTTKIKEHEKTQKKIKELREDFNKHQSETKDAIKTEMHE
jgi:hypothetical protein